ncbi:MAG: HNH endonuclease [Saprospirales bacterium]|nr:HNH endonuclease [Saprospirales bacterium]
MPRRYISESTKRAVEERADGRCEYCMSLRKFSPQPFIIEHIIPISKGGSDASENLALSCGGCNGPTNIKRRKRWIPLLATKLLFQPRNYDWATHFEWDAEYLQIIGLTPTGRATINALRLNRQELINLREVCLQIGAHPPKG